MLFLILKKMIYNSSFQKMVADTLVAKMMWRMNQPIILVNNLKANNREAVKTKMRSPDPEYCFLHWSIMPCAF